MGKLTVDINTASFQQNETKNKQLSILLGMGSLVYSISDLNTSKVEMLRQFELNSGYDLVQTYIEELVELFNSESFFNQDFKTTSIGFKSPAFTLVPERLYNEAAKGTYLAAVEEISHGEKLLHNHLPALEAHVVFSVNPDVFNLFNTKFEKARFYHSMSALLCGVKQLHIKTQSSAVYFHLSGRQLDLIYFKGEQLHFCNTYDFKTASDCLYYLLLIYDQFQLSQETIPLYLLGEIVEESKIYSLLYRYIKNISIISDIPFVRLDAAEHPMTTQYVNNLSLSVCPR